ncbi:hypothetical protein BZA05DRAFT_475452 [Tricharina praecox]|uniref:uncharacterized protein n=1 Tax=Tricharina praecox TaxID=43433 RepID=UPI0022201C6E|nr:uncharacterized protein BZA05DRAFT_475452 [Tricharina praecox]KAI5848397.1 hypothetical protein BZA05DRAFT_475452 [Tricharina praecox]
MARTAAKYDDNHNHNYNLRNTTRSRSRYHENLQIPVTANIPSSSNTIQMPQTILGTTTVVEASSQVGLLVSDPAQPPIAHLQPKRPPTDGEWKSPPKAPNIPFGDLFLECGNKHYGFEFYSYSESAAAAPRPSSPSPRALLEAAYNAINPPLTDARLGILDEKLRLHHMYNDWLPSREITADDYHNFTFFRALHDVYIAIAWYRVLDETSAMSTDELEDPNSASNQFERLMAAFLRGQDMMREHWEQFDRAHPQEPRKSSEQMFVRMNWAVMSAPGGKNWSTFLWPRLVVTHLSNPAKKWCGRQFRQCVKDAKLHIPWEIFVERFEKGYEFQFAGRGKKELFPREVHCYGGLESIRARVEACLEEPDGRDIIMINLA